MVGEGLSIIAAALLEAEDVGASTISDPARFPDDAFIDQNSELVPRNLYLQLARAGTFPCKKHGKKILAQWRDVRIAIMGTDLRPTQANDSQDELDTHRRSLGLVAKRRP